jgi:DNA-binding response OmpR family regulator
MPDDFSGFQILVVEDIPQMAKLTLMTLNRWGFQATHVADGETAIEFLKDNIPHLILLDLNLPGVSGWDVMDYLVNTHGAETVPVIVTTAFGDNANRLVGKLQSVYKYMVKPFTPMALIEAVKGALHLPV